MSDSITIRNPGLLSLIVDPGRKGHSDVGVPSSSALDLYACRALYALLASPDIPLIEALGPRLAVRFDADVTCALTGARVKAFLDDLPLPPWSSFTAKKGSILRIREVSEGFRYYLGFAGGLKIDPVMGSYATNLECRFGGFEGRPLRGGDILPLTAPVTLEARSFPEAMIPVMSPPHLLRVTEGPESEYLTPEARCLFWDAKHREPFIVSQEINRTGIRLLGKPLPFRKEMAKSIISEGIVPGTVQIPGDGLPIVMLHERTIGGYARAATVIRADLDRLAHLKPGDTVFFELVSPEAATAVWQEKKQQRDFFPSRCR